MFGVAMVKFSRIVNTSVISLLCFSLAGCGDVQAPSDLGQIFINLSASITGIWQLTTGFCYLAGVMFTATAVLKLKAYGELRVMAATSQASLKGPLIYLFVAAVFLYLPEAFSILMMTTFGYAGASTELQYTESPVGGFSLEAMEAVIQLIQLVGLFAFVRGWFMIAKLAHGPSHQEGIAKAVTHIIGGILAINILGTKDVLVATLGL